MRQFSSGATRDDDAGKLDFAGFLSPRVLRRFSEYMNEHRTQADGTLRGSDNWKLGIPAEAYMKSLARHFFDVWEQWDASAEGGKAWEDALCAMLFNVQGLLFESLGSGKVTLRQKIYSPDTDCKQKAMAGSPPVERNIGGTEWLEYYKKVLADPGLRIGLVPSTREEHK